jgi:hypothetical protein
MSPKIWYSFTTGRVQPYVAIASGLSRVRERNEKDPSSQTILGERRWGVNLHPEVGIQAYIFYAAFRYHIGSRTPKSPAFNEGQGNIFTPHYQLVFGVRYTIGGFNLD